MEDMTGVRELCAAVSPPSASPFTSSQVIDLPSPATPSNSVVLSGAELARLKSCHHWSGGKQVGAAGAVVGGAAGAVVGAGAAVVGAAGGGAVVADAWVWTGAGELLDAAALAFTGAGLFELAALWVADELG